MNKCCFKQLQDEKKKSRIKFKENLKTSNLAENRSACVAHLWKKQLFADDLKVK